MVTFAETRRVRREANKRGKWSHLPTVTHFKPVHHCSLHMTALGPHPKPTPDGDRTRVAILFCKGRDWAGMGPAHTPLGTCSSCSCHVLPILSPQEGGGARGG